MGGEAARSARKRQANIGRYVVFLPHPMMTLVTPRAPMHSQTMPIPLGDAGTSATIQQMRRLIDEGSKDPVVYELATQIVRHVRPFDYAAEGAAIFNWMRANIRYTRHVRGTQTLHAARETVRLGVGDCPMYTVLALALAAAVGIRGRIVTIAADSEAPEEFTHVYPEILAGNRWIALDAARRDPAFAKTPGSYFRKRVWDANSEDYEDVAGLNGMGAHHRTFSRRAASTAHTRAQRHWYRKTQPVTRNLRFLPGTGLGDASDPTSETSILSDIAVAGQVATQAINAANQPYNPYLLNQVPAGVSPYAINPATGQPYVNQASVVSPYASVTGGISSGTLLLLGGAVLVVFLMRGRS
jgi:Transglutaminase-like superfamily